MHCSAEQLIEILCPALARPHMPEPPLPHATPGPLTGSCSFAPGTERDVGLQLKHKAPKAHTYLEIVKVRRCSRLVCQRLSAQDSSQCSRATCQPASADACAALQARWGFQAHVVYIFVGGFSTAWMLAQVPAGRPAEPARLLQLCSSTSS